MEVQDPAEMDRCAAVFTVAAYVVANLEERLPLSGDYPQLAPEPDAALALQAWPVYSLALAVAATLVAG